MLPKRIWWLYLRIPARFLCALNCLRGRPTCYRMIIRTRGIELQSNSMVMESSFINERDEGWLTWAGASTSMYPGYFRP